MTDVEQPTAPAIVDQRYEVVPIDSIEPHPLNPNIGDSETIGESIDEIGFFGACIVHEPTRRILAGRHRWDEFRERGAAEIPVIFVDVEDLRAAKILSVDNAARDRAEYDRHKQVELLDHIAAHDADLLGSGVSRDEYERIRAELDPTSESRSPFSEFPDTPKPDVVDFRFGDYSGKVQRATYLTFVAAYEAKREETAEVMLDEVLLLWLGLS